MGAGEAVPGREKSPPVVAKFCNLRGALSRGGVAGDGAHVKGGNRGSNKLESASERGDEEPVAWDERIGRTCGNTHCCFFVEAVEGTGRRPRRGSQGPIMPVQYRNILKMLITAQKPGRRAKTTEFHVPTIRMGVQA